MNQASSRIRKFVLSSGFRLENLRETAKLVEDVGGSIFTHQADVGSLEQLVEAQGIGLSALCRIDIAVADAGFISGGPTGDLSKQQWQDVIGVDPDGVWKTCETVFPEIRRAGTGESIVVISSTAGRGTADQFLERVDRDLVDLHVSGRNSAVVRGLLVGASAAVSA
ncbi:SDR family NAD(P)-dependent oxidoreductase [Rhodococcoides yunnanense]|uniref:SDR family NAD(P)-dependent oxidoreductase n=1 Tax=Rhodococcoides yunnanense TaxID=278209 RepID=UPI0009321F3F